MNETLLGNRAELLRRS